MTRLDNLIVSAIKTLTPAPAAMILSASYTHDPHIIAILAASCSVFAISTLSTQYIHARTGVR